MNGLEYHRGTAQILCFVDRASLYNLFQMKPTRCTLLLSISISTSVHVSGNYMPIIRRTYCICATLAFFSLYGWLSVLLVGMIPGRFTPGNGPVTKGGSRAGIDEANTYFS